MSSTFAGAGAAERSEGGGGSLLDGGGGTLLGVDGGDESILPDGGGTNRPEGGGATIRPDGGGTSFPIGGIEGARETGAEPTSEPGALGRDEAVSPLRFFSSGKSPSEAGLSLLGEDDVSILNTPRPPDRPCGGKGKTIHAFPRCARANRGLGGSFLLSDSPRRQRCRSGGRKCDTWLHAVLMSHPFPPFGRGAALRYD